MANEFKVKNALLIEGSTNSQRVVAIRDSSLEITSDASSLLVTAKAIHDYISSATGDSYWELDGSTLKPKDNTVNVELSAIQVDTDAGEVTLVDMDVSSAGSGVPQSYAFNIDGEPIAKIYAEGDGAGGIREEKLVSLKTFVAESSVYFMGIGQATQTKVLYYNPTSGIVSYQDPCVGGISSVAWGDITGNLRDQTDVSTAIDAKQNKLTFGSSSGIPYSNGVSNFNYDASFFRSSELFRVDLLEFDKTSASTSIKHDSSTVIAFNVGNDGGTVLYSYDSSSNIEIYPNNTNFNGKNFNFSLGTTVSSFIYIKDNYNVTPKTNTLLISSPTDTKEYLSVKSSGSIYCASIGQATQTKVLFYNPTSGEVTYADPCTGINSVTWGDITGSLSSQTDLNNYLTDLSTNKQDDITFGTPAQIPYINAASDDFEYGGLEFNKNTGDLFVKANEDTDSPSITLRDGSNNSSSLTFDNATSSTTLSGDSAKRLQLAFSNVCIGTTFSDTTTLLVKSASTGHVLSVFYNYNDDIVHRIAADGSVYFPLLAQSSQTKALYYNPVNGLITYSDPCTGESAAWGNIDGDITSQNDLWTILNDLSTNKFDKSGGTITGDVTITDSSLIINTGNVEIGGDLAVAGNLVVDGSLIVIGVETIDVSANFIHLNTGLTGTPPSWLQSGIVVERGSSNSYAFIFDETIDTFRIGVVSGPDASGVFNDSETQAVATRQDTPISGGLSYWNDSLYRFDTSIHLRYSGGNLQINNDISVGSQIFAPNLTQAGNANIVFWNSTTGELTRGDASSLGFDTSTFLSLHDTPNSYLDGSAGSAVVINDAGNGLEFAPRIWREESDEVTLANEKANVLFYENIEIEADSGIGTFVDKDVTSSSAENTEESYTFDINGSTVAKIYGVSDGGGSLKEYGFVVETYQYMGDPGTNGSWRFYVNGSGDLVFEKKISGTWTEKGKFTE